MTKILLLFITLLASCVGTDKPPTSPKVLNSSSAIDKKPLRIAIIGLVHDHVHWMMLNRKKIGDIEIVAIVEANQELVKKYSQKYGFSTDIVFNTIEEMLAHIKPEAVTAFNMTSEHLKVVEACAPLGIHIMLEKPLATSLVDAKKMFNLANQYQVQLLTNYETSWYPSIRETYRLIHQENLIGEIRRIIINVGNRGPIEVGCKAEFIEWLIDPKFNGAGALADFGCYGTNLATWFMKGAPPTRVNCLTQQFKPELYPKVDDDATLILTYPKAQVIIQASWHWSLNRKDIEIYGSKGHIICKNSKDMIIMKYGQGDARSQVAPPLDPGLYDGFAYLRKVIRENDPVRPFSPSALDNNLLVMRVYEAAKQSSETAQTIYFKTFESTLK
ncbi:Gfo/Idh/MocA family oxidoreductase [Lentisphaera profundi]|uniref:Gfo/Idh/MocA family oxidoreductase n=1 Tax=Lentisphaera profundi TaxID=1658616 RepID=A0ABY7VRC5_9BACT|nr:Gfo/Idh/MocA family oxidoreductase [Lentisphaera profundi]WDE95785.1 Gfo/Idh/MocA family oxidoreductase [Lentisphaera profundi]